MAKIKSKAKVKRSVKRKPASEPMQKEMVADEQALNSAREDQQYDRGQIETVKLGSKDVKPNKFEEAQYGMDEELSALAKAVTKEEQIQAEVKNKPAETPALESAPGELKTMKPAEKKEVKEEKKVMPKSKAKSKVKYKKKK